MNLYAFQPKGHGSFSFFVMAENEGEARRAVDHYVRESIDKSEHDGSYLFTEGECEGWGTDYYVMTVAGVGQVISNAND